MRTPRSMTRVALVLVAALVTASGLTGCRNDADGKVVTYGALVPMTGALADTGPDLQQALIFAAEQVNAAGGVAGDPIRIRIQDTFSDPERGAAGGQALIADHPELLGLVGPQEDDVARLLLPTLREQGIAGVSGGPISTSLSQENGFFFRTNPSALQLGQTLSLHMDIDGMKRVGVLFVNTEAGRSLSGQLANAFQALKGVIVAPGSAYQGPISVAPAQASYREVLTGFLALNPDALVLLTDPVTGAQLVRDWVLLGGTGKLYFGPNLRADVFVQTVPPGAIDGMKGVSAGVASDAAQFAAQYTERFGNPPPYGAYFSFDALAMLALASQEASVEGKGTIDRATLATHLRHVSSSDGEEVSWSELGRAMDLVAAGKTVNYRGASGHIIFKSGGDVNASTEVWQVKSSVIVTQ